MSDDELAFGAGDQVNDRVTPSGFGPATLHSSVHPHRTLSAPAGFCLWSDVRVGERDACFSSVISTFFQFCCGEV